MKAANYPIRLRNIKYKVFLIKSRPVSFIIIGFRVRGIKKIAGATRNCGRWSDSAVVKLPEIILGTAMLEKVLSINVLELVVTLLGCRIWGRK